MSPKPRKPENQHLPSRWRYKHGAFYYRVPKGLESEWDGKQEFRLGKTEAEAYRTWALRVEVSDDLRLMQNLFDRYANEVVPLKAPKTQESNRISLRRLRMVFGQVPVTAVKPRHAYKYRDEVTKRHGPSSANRDLEVLSHSLSKAVEWGVIDRNPIKGQVRKNTIPRRDRYVEDWEIAESLTVATPMLRAYVVLKLLTALRRSDLLRLRFSDLRPDGIHVSISKTRKAMIIEWTDELQLAVATARYARSIDVGPWLFCTRQGRCYVNNNGSANAFDSLWQRFMTRVLEKTRVKERFQEKDLRKKTASDMTLGAAQRLLGHADPNTTARHYRIAGEIVKPHSLKDRKERQK